MAALIGVGVGPGDPELITAQALRVLREADRVFAPTTAVDAVGRAESIVRQAAPEVRVQRLPFVMVEPKGESAVQLEPELRNPHDDARAGRGFRGEPGLRGPNGGRGAERVAALAAAADRIAACLDAGEDVAFVTLGDPNIYSTFPTVAAAVHAERPDVEIRTVAGIMAFQALAAEAGTVLLDGRESLALVTALDGPAALDAALVDPDRAVIAYKGGRHLPAIAASLARAGRLDGAVVGELLGLPGERVGPVKELADGPASYLATVIVPPVGRSSS